MAGWPPVWEGSVYSVYRECLSWAAVDLNVGCFPFGFEGRMWDLIVSAPDHCLSFYFSSVQFINSLNFSIFGFE